MKLYRNLGTPAGCFLLFCHRCRLQIPSTKEASIMQNHQDTTELDEILEEILRLAGLEDLG